MDWLVEWNESELTSSRMEVYAMNAVEVFGLLNFLSYACDDFIVRLITCDRIYWVEFDNWCCDENDAHILRTNEKNNTGLTFEGE